MVMAQKAVLNVKIQIGMEDNKKNILGKYKGKPYPPLEENPVNLPKLVKEENDYHAFSEYTNRKSIRFRIVDAKGKSYGCSYAHLIDWVFESPTLLTLTTASRIFTFRGKNLTRIESLLMEDRIKELFVFNSMEHRQPASNKPIIEELIITEAV